jgi:hypothetical protein
MSVRVKPGLQLTYIARERPAYDIYVFVNWAQATCHRCHARAGTIAVAWTDTGPVYGIATVFVTHSDSSQVVCNMYILAEA